jgi:hypothetical protein
VDHRDQGPRQQPCPAPRTVGTLPRNGVRLPRNGVRLPRNGVRLPQSGVATTPLWGRGARAAAMLGKGTGKSSSRAGPPPQRSRACTLDRGRAPSCRHARTRPRAGTPSGRGGSRGQPRIGVVAQRGVQDAGCVEDGPAQERGTRSAWEQALAEGPCRHGGPRRHPAGGLHRPVCPAALWATTQRRPP